MAESSRIGPTVATTLAATSLSSPNDDGQRESHPELDQEENLTLNLTTVPFRLAWWIAFLSHALCIAFLCLTTALYVFLGGFNMIYYNKLLGSTLRNQMGNLGYVFVGMAALHFVEMLMMVINSVRSRELSFRVVQRRDKITPSMPVSAQGGNALAARMHQLRLNRPRLPPALHRILPLLVGRSLRNCLREHQRPLPKLLMNFLRRGKRMLKRAKTKLFDRKQGFFGIESPYFNALFLLREGVEIASQSYQMYQCSQLIASKWINVLFLAITVANCWSTPLLQHVLARFNALERVVCLSLDGLMDAGTCMLIPMIIVMKYVNAFDRELLEFPIENLTDPEWFAALILENRMLLAMNKTDLFSSLVPHYSLFSCMRKVKRLLCRFPTLETVSIESNKQSSKAAAGGTASADIPSAALQSTQSQRFDAKIGEIPGWKRRFVHVFFIGWGATILGVHLRARQVAVGYSAYTACKQQLRPWFATSFMCATYEFDCVAQGNIASIEASHLAVLDPSPLSSLIISNCPALVMPDEIANFSGLLKVLVYNSTVADWSSNASLNAEAHPALISICIVSTSMPAGLPAGLQSRLPDSLQDIQFAQTDLAELPTSIAQSWPAVTKVFFEYCAFAEFPLPLISLRLDDLSLAGNQLRELPDGLKNMSFSFQNLVVNDNPVLVALPTTGAPRVGALSIESTGFTELPQSLYSSLTQAQPGGEMGGGPMANSLVVYAHGTPMCAALGGESDSDVGYSNGTITLNSAGVLLFCSTRDPNGFARFPLAWTSARFAPT